MSEHLIRVLIVDDQALIREGLETLLTLSPGVEVAGTARDGEEAERLADERRPDVVLMDLRMPRRTGVEATRRITQQHPEIRVIALTTYADDASIFGALEAGAMGYLTKDAGAREIVQAIQTVHAGEALLDPAVQARVLRQLRAGQPASKPPATLPADLTPREADVLRLIAQGLNNREIADRLFVTEATVKTHINSIFSKTGVRDRAQAVVYAMRQGLTES